jgi:hypothetical protein
MRSIAHNLNGPEVQLPIEEIDCAYRDRRTSGLNRRCQRGNLLRRDGI